jgi:CRP/FNR family nitrogen fixation transcriptional regulator
MVSVGKPPVVTGKHNANGFVNFPEPFVDELTLKRALSALQCGPIRFRRNNVIACEGDAADYIFFVTSGVIRTCKTFKNGTRAVVAFYLPGDLFGWDDEKCTLSVEAASDAMVLLIKRAGLISLARRDNRISNFLLAITTNELRRAQRHGVLMSRIADERVKTFLADLSKRMRSAGYVDLPMSHNDIADHLGLTIETLSRTITRLERLGVVTRSSARKLLLRNQTKLGHAIN